MNKIHSEQGFIMPTVIVLVAIAVIIGGVLLINQNKQTKDSDLAQKIMEETKMNAKENMTNDDKASDSADVMMKKEDKTGDEKVDEKMMQDKESTAMMKDKAGVYKDYSATLATSESALGRKVVLFFYAPWCPFCQAADKAFIAEANNIPENITLLKTSYDNEKELKAKYGVTYQHTFVQIDAQGNAVTKWVSGDVELLKKNLK